MLINRRGERKAPAEGWRLSIKFRDKTVTLFDENGVQIFSCGDDKFYARNLHDFRDCIDFARAIAWSHGYEADVDRSSDYVLNFKFIKSGGR